MRIKLYGGNTEEIIESEKKKEIPISNYRKTSRQRMYNDNKGEDLIEKIHDKEK